MRSTSNPSPIATTGTLRLLDPRRTKTATIGTRPQVEVKGVRVGDNLKSRNVPMNIYEGKTFEPTLGSNFARASGATRNKPGNFGLDHYLTFMGHERVKTAQSKSSQGNYKAPHRHLNKRDQREGLEGGSKGTILPAQVYKSKNHLQGSQERRAPSRNQPPMQTVGKTAIRDNVLELHKKMHLHPHRPTRKAAATFLQPSYSLVNK